jgi:hypothetical protein
MAIGVGTQMTSITIHRFCCVTKESSTRRIRENLATGQRRKQKNLRITLYFGDLLLNLLSKYGDLKNIKIKSLTPLDFSVFFWQKSLV